MGIETTSRPMTADEIKARNSDEPMEPAERLNVGEYTITRHGEDYWIDRVGKDGGECMQVPKEDLENMIRGSIVAFLEYYRREC